MNYLLTGAEFNNKGAEAMTLIALKNIYENDLNAKVYLFYTGNFPIFNFYHKIHYINLPLWDLNILNGNKKFTFYKTRIKAFIKRFLPWKKSSFSFLLRTKFLLKKIDIMIDISGFAFSSKWGDEGTINWLKQIDLMEKMGSKIWLMPQSFGPFDFNSKKVLDYGKTVLEKCECIYAREESGYKLLKELGLKNINQMTDSVLIEKNFNPALIIKDFKNYSENIEISNSHNIAIIPNYRLIDVGGIDLDKILNFYSELINKYKKKYTFYLIAHAGEDLYVCKKIKERFIETNNVILIDHVLLSFNYEEFTKKMDFIIASRYHSIIHAYKEYIPAIVLGWADKYVGIVSELNQEKYLIELNNYNKALNQVDNMIKNYKQESKVIENKLKKLQEHSCYDFLKNLGFRK